MLKYFTQIALRSFKKDPVYPVISVICLTLGIAIALLTVVYIKNELSFDRFHTNAENIYRVADYFKTPDMAMKGSTVRIPVGSDLKEMFPEIKNMVRLSRRDEDYIFYPREIATPTHELFFTDTSFFSIFSFNLTAGDPKTCLLAENSMVITEKTALRWFGNENPLGKPVRTNKKATYIVTGVVKNPPINSQIRFSVLLPISIITNNKSLYLKWDGGPDAYTYLLLKPGTNPQQLEKKFIPLLWEKVNKKYSKEGWSESLYLQPLLKIHLNSDTDIDIHKTGNKESLIVLSAIALAILLLGCINFFNLSTLQNISRIKDTSIRKIAGTGRFSLALKYITEASLINILAVLLGIALAELCLPLFNNMSGGKISISYNGFTLIFCLMMALLPGIIIGMTTAARYSNINPVKVLRKETKSGHTPVTRDILVIAQFTIAIALLISTAVMTRQINFFLKKDLGYNPRNVVAIPLSENISKKAYVFRDEIMKVAGVRKASLSTAIPGRGLTSNGYKPEGKETIMIHALGVDENFFETLHLPMASGTTFTDNKPADHMAFVINETLTLQLGWDNPLGKTIERNNKKKVITGVCKDFNFAPLQNKIEPLVIDPISVTEGGSYSYLLVSFETNDLQAALKNISAIWNREEPNEPYNGQFLDEQFASTYSKEMHERNLLLTFTVLAIVIAALGLFSISLYNLSTRTKEIGLRKVNGASTREILFLINKSFVTWVVISFIIACPIAWYFMHKWLQGFAYKIALSGWIYLLSGFATFTLVLITVSWQAYRASSKNPVEALRYE